MGQGGTEREKALAEAIMAISHAPVYERRGEPASGISVQMIGAIREAVDLAKADGPCAHDFGMLGLCVKCGANDGTVLRAE